MSAFDDSSQGPPPMPPRDAELRRNIEQLAEVVAQNGPDAEVNARRENQGNPKFAFLVGGPFADYYAYCLHVNAEAIRGQNPVSERDQMHNRIQELRQEIQSSERNLKLQLDSLPQLKEAEIGQQIAAGEHQKVMGYLISAQLDVTQFDQYLQALNSSKSSKEAIANCKRWITDTCQTDRQREVICMYLLSRVKDATSCDSFRLNILYLINDWAYQCQRKKLDPVTQMLSRYVPQMYAFTIECTTDAVFGQRLDKLIGNWEGHKYFNDTCFKQLRNPSHIYTSSKNALSAEYAKLASTVEDQLQAMYAGYEQQHMNFARHNESLIAQLQSKMDGTFSENMNRNARRSRFDQQSCNDAGFFNPPPVVRQRPGYVQEKVPDGDDIDGHPFDEDELVPKLPYYMLPAGIMVPQVAMEHLTYDAIAPENLRLPPTLPPSQRLLESLDRFYALPSMDRPIDGAGWERDGLSDFFDRKLRLRNILMERLNADGKKLETLITNKFTDEDVKLAKADREIFIKKTTEELRNRKRDHSRSISRSRSRSRSKSGSRSRSRSNSRSRDRRRRHNRSGSSSSSRSNASKRSRSNSSRRSRSRSRSRSASPNRRPLFKRSASPERPSFGFSQPRGPPAPLSSDNKGAMLMAKMGWSGKGLGAQESGIVEPVNAGEVRDRNDQFRGLGSRMDMYEQFRKQRSGNYHEKNQQAFGGNEKDRNY